jgi:hypothetical protein
MKTQVSLAEQLKAELMERYGLRADQVRLEVNFYTEDLGLGNLILDDFERSTAFPSTLKPNQPCQVIFGDKIEVINVHRKDGFYSEYAHDTEGEDNE